MLNIQKEITDIETLHTNRVFADDQISIDPIIDKYRKTHLPNECIYIIDCKRVEVLSVTSNEDKVLNIKDFGLENLMSLYEHTKNNFEDIVHFNKKLVNVGFNAKHGITKEDMFTSTYVSSGDATIYKRTCLLEKDSLNNVVYTVGSLINVSGYVPKPTKFKTEFIGPNSKRFSAHVNGVLNYQKLLSDR